MRIKLSITLFLICLLSFTPIWAQDLQWTFDDRTLQDGEEITVGDYDPVMGRVTVDLGIVNNTTNTVQVTVAKEIQELIQGAEVLLCVGELCYPPNAMQTNEIEITAGQTNHSFHAYYEPGSEYNYGTTVVTFILSNQTYTTHVKVRFSYSDQATASTTIQTHQSYFVWQSGNSLSIRGTDDENTTVQVLNLLGQKVFSGTVPAGNQLQTPALKKGIYIVSFLGKDNKMETRKVIIR